VCDELNIVVLEQRAGRPRGDAWKHMAERTDVDCVRNLVTMLVQAEQFGTSVAKTLRIHSDTLRTQRVQAVEEAAAKTTIKLLFRLCFSSFPRFLWSFWGPRCFPSWIRSRVSIIKGRRNRYGYHYDHSGCCRCAVVVILIVLIQRRRTRIK
jgi:hypothetical protein